MGNDILTIILGSLGLGGVYALIALGYTMVYGIAKMLNFAHGDLIMVGGFVFFELIKKAGLNVFVSIPVALVFCALLAILMERLAYKPLRGASPLAVLITAIGVSFFLQSLGQIIFGSSTKGVSLFSTLTTIQKTLIVIGVSTIIMVMLTMFINFSKIGKAMRAVSEDRGAAQLMGINTNRIITLTFTIGGTLAAVASFCYIMMYPISVNPTMGSIPGIIAFTAAVVGGIGSIPGAMLGGFLIGFIETIVSYTPLAGYKTAIEFAILILILIVRPIGILGKRKGEKV